MIITGISSLLFNETIWSYDEWKYVLGENFFMCYFELCSLHIFLVSNYWYTIHDGNYVECISMSKRMRGILELWKSQIDRRNSRRKLADVSAKLYNRIKYFQFNKQFFFTSKKFFFLNNFNWRKRKLIFDFCVKFFLQISMRILALSRFWSCPAQNE